MAGSKPPTDGDEPQLVLDFDGETYVREHDGVRLSKQFMRVFNCMVRGRWMTLQEISEVTGDQPQSISARLRDLRKPRFGAHFLARRRRGLAAKGIHEYRLTLNPDPPDMEEDE